MARLRLAIVTNIPTPYRKGFFAALAARPEIDLTIFYCASIERNRSWGDQAGSGYMFQFLRGITLGTSFHINLSVPLKLARGRFEAVVFGGYSYPSVMLALLSSRALGLKTIMWLDGAIGSGVPFLKRALLSLADQYIVASNMAKESLIRIGVEPRLINVVPLTVDVRAWRSAYPSQCSFDQVALCPQEQKRRTVLFCGRLVPSKNVDFVIELASRMNDLHDVTFLLVGDGPLAGELHRKVEGSRLSNVVFLGFVPPEQLPPIFAQSEILLLPSLHEPWGAVVNEALAAGIPAMVSRAAGATDLIEDGRNGYIIEPKDIKHAESLLRRYLADEKIRREMKYYAMRSGTRLTHEFAADLICEGGA